jgi:heterodisulfide reductase subunit A
MEVKVFYIDIRAFGKGFEDLFRRSKGMGVRYIRGLPGDIKQEPATRDLVLTVENTATNELESHHTEMVVLAVGLEPPADMKYAAMAGPGLYPAAARPVHQAADPGLLPLW